MFLPYFTFSAFYPSFAFSFLFSYFLLLLAPILLFCDVIVQILYVLFIAIVLDFREGKLFFYDLIGQTTTQSNDLSNILKLTKQNFLS